MFTSILRALGLVPHTFDSIVSDFQTAIDRLENHASVKFQQSQIHQAVITDALKARDAAHDEAAKALAIVTKLTGIINP